MGLPVAAAATVAAQPTAAPTAPTAPTTTAATPTTTAATPTAGTPTTTTKTAATATGKFPGEDPQGAGYVGRREVARRQAARDAAAAKKPAAPNFGQQTAGYKSVNYAPTIKTGVGLPKPAAAAAPTKTPTQAEKDAYVKSIGAPAMAETSNEKIGGRYEPDEFDAMMSRLKKLAGAGPLKTVYDPAKRVYKNVPTAVQPPTQPKK
jgi:hypothetical protein